jgi:hypothetical protein
MEVRFLSGLQKFDAGSIEPAIFFVNPACRGHLHILTLSSLTQINLSF